MAYAINARAAAAAPVPSNIKAHGNVSGALTIDANDGEFQTLTVAGVTTLTLTGGSTNNVRPLTLEITNGGAYTFNWPAAVDFSKGTAPTLTAAGVDVIQLYAKGASNWFAARAGENIS